MNSLIAARVAHQLESIAQIRLEETQLERGGQTFAALRPKSLADSPQFAIALSNSFIWAEATFVADAYAGSIIRRMSERVLDKASDWPEIVAEAAPRVTVHLQVNGQGSSVDDVPLSVWRSLELECSTRLERFGTAADLERALVLVGGVCLSLVVSALNIEQTNELDEALPEGARTEVTINRYERNPANRERCIRFHGAKCWVCDFSFEAVYGAIGAGFIEVHHVTPLSLMEGPISIDPTRDLIPLCSNCHSMIHAQTPPLLPLELRTRLVLEPKAWPGGSST